MTLKYVTTIKGFMMGFERREDEKYMKRSPVHPGEMLREEFMRDYNMSVSELASCLGVSRQTINELVHERRSVTPNIALRLQNLFGTSAETWMNMQQKYDLWQFRNAHRKEIDSVKPIAMQLAHARA